MLPNKLNLAFVTPYLPLPLNDGSKIRDYNILIRLAQHADVHLISYVHQNDDLALIDNLRDICSTVHLINHTYWKDHSNFKNVLRFTNSLLCLEPFTIFDFSSPLLNKIIFECIIKYKIQVVQAQKLQMVNCLKSLPSNVLRVLDEHNIETEAWHSRYLNTKILIPNRLLAYIQRNLTKGIEFNVEKYADIIFTVSEYDRKILQKGLKNLTNNQAVISAKQSVDTSFFCPDSVKSINTDIPGKNIVFTGSMSYAPNVDAVLYFVSEIFPHIKAKSNHNFTFWVVGTQPSDSVKKLAKLNNSIIVTGEVPDVRPYLKLADVAIAPIRFGGGTKTKILEALSMKLPTVASIHAMEGIDDCGQDISSFLVTTDDPLLFADSVINFSNSKCLIGNWSREFVKNNYSWDTAVNNMLNVYQKFLTEKSNLLY